MYKNRFFKAEGPYSLRKVAANCRVISDVESDKEFVDVAPLSAAGPDTISFLDNSKYRTQLSQTKAGAVFITKENADFVPDNAVALICANPHLSFALASSMFYPNPQPNGEVHSTAQIHANAMVGDGCEISPGVVISANAEIGENCIIGPNVYIGPKVVIGANSRIGASATIEYCTLGQRCNIHPGVRIGMRGFGFAIDPEGFVDVPQTGAVVIGNAVEIGANCTIDRGMGQDTQIGDGCKIDNLIHIAHNVKLGRGCVLAAMSGVAGSTELGDFVICGAQVGISGHLRIGDGCQIAARAGVTKNLKAGSIVGGFPAEPLGMWRKRHAFLSRLMKNKG
ncbi:MAG: UDP-3-O-(3-hydroxymyristoyl)glucosamine N-acyltransferase [Alphaproteobacteria bacterium]|nr:UDP-3-O-(3-hydroxymyristoyl)glucosamine N-acyltransferase [Alphaproteobacteria bacterium]